MTLGRTNVGTIFPFLCLIMFAILALPLTQALGSPPEALEFAPLKGIPQKTLAKMNGPLKLLLSTRARPETHAAFLTEKALEPDVSVIIKFKNELNPQEISVLENQGVKFERVDGKISRAGTIYAGRVQWELLTRVAERNDVELLESVWKPRLLPCLDVSAPEIEAPQAWQVTDGLGDKVTGKGIIIADFDTSVDVYHPMLFKADADTFNWLDVDMDSFFDTGTDGVDLNKDTVFDANERLRFFDGPIYDPAGTFGGGGGTSNIDGIFQAYWDWLYNDANSNAVRDYGTSAGFNESSPSLGERIFIAIDSNGNGQLNVGEQLLGLGTSKIAATMNTGSVERTRGVNLMQTDPDNYGHGTPVCGIIAGHKNGFGKFTGIAPDAELLVGNYFSDISIVTLLSWASSRDADAVLYEGASFAWEPLDGSTPAEQTVDAYADSIIQVTPAGNLARGYKHAQMFIQPSDTDTAQVWAPSTYGGYAVTYMWITFLWRTPSDSLGVVVKTPIGGSVQLNQDWTYQYIDGYELYSGRSTSSRGTAELDMQIRKLSGNVAGTWNFAITNRTASVIEEVNGYVADNASSWDGGAEFQNFRSNDKTVCSVATADSAFTLASYSTRGYDSYYGVGGGSVPPGALSEFSSRGKRVDDVSIMEIASPGNYDVYTARSHYGTSWFGGYRQFSGTSAAGPHVAGACGLVKQYYPLATPADLKYRITRGALADSFTGAVPNDSWGYGKLRVYHALAWPLTGTELPLDFLESPIVSARLFQNYPNPFNPATVVQYELPRESHVKVAIYDAQGRLVRTLVNERQFAGRYLLAWDGLDSRGIHPSSGVYFIKLEASGRIDSRKMVLLR